MNYQAHYDRLIERARLRQKPEVYCENHHIVPKCLGGSDKPENLVYLTAKEHYVAHLLTARVYGGKCKKALFMMGNFYGRKNSTLYADARKFVSEQAVEIGRANGRTGFVNKTGFHARSKEQMSLDGKVGGKIGGQYLVDNKIGIFNRDAKQMTLDGKKGGRSAFEKKAGLFSKPIKEWNIDHVAAGRKGGSLAGKMPWWNNPDTRQTRRSYYIPGDGFVLGRGNFKIKKV